jgi:hypothetical protein
LFCRTFGAQDTAWFGLRFHALTDVAITYRAFGAQQLLFQFVADYDHFVVMMVLKRR